MILPRQHGKGTGESFSFCLSIRFEMVTPNKDRVWVVRASTGPVPACLFELVEF